MSPEMCAHIFLFFTVRQHMAHKNVPSVFKAFPQISAWYFSLFECLHFPLPFFEKWTIQKSEMLASKSLNEHTCIENSERDMLRAKWKFWLLKVPIIKFKSFYFFSVMQSND